MTSKPITDEMMVRKLIERNADKFESSEEIRRYFYELAIRMAEWTETDPDFFRRLYVEGVVESGESAEDLVAFFREWAVRLKAKGN